MEMLQRLAESSWCLYIETYERPDGKERFAIRPEEEVR